MNINIQNLHGIQRNNQGIFWIAVILFMLIGGCTKEKPEAPHVLELNAIPQSITISDKYFYPKPFTIRAKYSDKTEKNISSRVSWLSENIALLSINQKGELEKKAECLKNKCMVSLVATDPESGKSIRLTVNMSRKKNQAEKKTADNRNKTSDHKQEQQTPVRESELNKVFSEEPGDELIEQEPADAIQSLQFAPQVDSTRRSESTEISNRQSQKQNVLIHRLEFEERSIVLTSGDIYQVKTHAIDTLGKYHVNHNVSYDCYVTEALNLSVIVLSNCQLVAVKPGEAEIGIKINEQGVSNIESNTFLKIKVKPNIINASREGFNRQIQLTKENFQTWYQISNLDNFSYYRAKLASNISQGLRLFVYVRPTLQYPTCLNTLPAKSNSVACYFQSAENDVMIVVENMLEKATRANLVLSPADSRLFLNQSLHNIQSPAKLALDILETNFIMANESGGNNKHYYTFDTENTNDRDLFIKLYDFSAPIELSVNWPGGFCNNEMMNKQANEVVCRVPATASGNLNIVIDGNNGEFGVLNGPAAAEGGTFYKLLVKYTE